MDLYEKLDELVKKAEELDAVGDKFVALDDKENPAQAYAVERAMFELADELDKIADTFTDEELDTIRDALSYEEFMELQRLIDESSE